MMHTVDLPWFINNQNEQKALANLKRKQNQKTQIVNKILLGALMVLFALMSSEIILKICS